MSNIKLDLSKFKHKHSDEHKTTLVHEKDGHEITVMHKALSKEGQEQFKALAGASKSQLKEKIPRLKEADGGEIAPQEGYFGTLPTDQGPLPTPPLPSEQTPVKTAEDRLADDTAAEQAKMADRYGVPAQDAKLLKPQAETRALDNEINQKKDQELEAQKVVDNRTAAYQKELAGLDVENQKRQALGLSPKPSPIDPNAPAQTDGIASEGAQAPMPSDQPQQPMAASASGTTPNPTQSQPAVPQAPRIPSPAEQLMSEDKAWQNDLNNGHIEPKTYESMFASKDTLGKIGTIFGLMSSGIGSGLTGKSNMLMDMMDNTIKNDLEAQKASKSNALSFKNLAEQHLMNQANIGHMQLNDAVTRDAFAQQLAGRAAFHKLMMQTQAMPDGPQKQAAMQTLGMISQGLDARALSVGDQLNAKQALYGNMMSGGSGNGSPDEQFAQHQRQLRMTGNSELAKDNEAKYIPGVGMASIPLTADDRTKVQSGIQFGNQLKRFMDWTSKHSGSIDPTIVNQGKTLASELQGSYRQATNGGVYKEGEQHFISGLIDSDPTKFFNKIRVIPQLQAIAHEHNARMGQLMQSVGLPPTAGQSSAAAQTPEIRTVNKVQYQKVNGGWAKISK